MNAFDRQSARYQTDREKFEEHIERVRAFRRAQDLDKPDQHSPAPDDGHEELQNILPSLMKISYLLNLIQERSTVLLPLNWQN